MQRSVVGLLLVCIAGTSAGTQIAPIADVYGSVFSPPYTDIFYSQFTGQLRLEFGELQVNALGQRVVKTSASGIATVYHYDSTGRLIAESDAQGNVQTEYLYLGDIPVAVIQ